MSSPPSEFQERTYPQQALEEALFGTEARLADAGVSWNEYVEGAEQELYQRGMDSFFFGLGDTVDKGLQDFVFNASVAISELRSQSRDAKRWNGAQKLKVIELLLQYTDRSDHHELESPTARYELQKQVAVDRLTRIVDAVINAENKEEE